MDGRAREREFLPVNAESELRPSRVIRLLIAAASARKVRTAELLMQQKVRSTSGSVEGQQFASP